MENVRFHLKNSEKGSALLLVLAIMMTLTVLGMGVIISSSSNFALARNYERAVQARNMSEIGLKVAYREFINSGFLKTTHTEDLGDPQTGEALLDTTLVNSYIDGNGDFVWEWDDGDTYDPLWDTEIPHGFKFRVYYYTENAFVLESEGWFGPIHKRNRAKGEIETMFQFSYFASRDLGEFVRGASQEIRGKVHANGNMFVRPSGSDLNVNSSSFTATGFIIRTRDAWGRPDESGRCFITKTAEGGTFVEMEPDVDGLRGSDGSAFDSFNFNWSDQDDGARANWGGVVRDKVPYKSPPPVQNLEPGGYYDILAQSGGVVIDNMSHLNTWCQIVNIPNYNEDRTQTAWEVNIGDMIAAGAWPGNGLIYCNVPIRITNAAELFASLMIASCRNIYTFGDFNTVNKKGASIMTRHRINHLSNNWSDTWDSNKNNRQAVTTTINGALVDGAPTVDEYNWCDRDGNHCYDYPDNDDLIYDNWEYKTAAGFNNPANSGNPWANCDDLLEKWSGQTLTKFGSVVHLGNSNDIMADNLDNSGIQDNQIAWIRTTGYDPPIRNYSYDPDLATPGGQPPFTPFIGHLTSWEPY